jgi:transposase InsO family protein
VGNSQSDARAEARKEIFEYPEVFYNRRRRHSSIGYVSPESAGRVEARAVSGQIVELAEDVCVAGSV